MAIGTPAIAMAAVVAIGTPILASACARSAAASALAVLPDGPAMDIPVCVA